MVEGCTGRNDPADYGKASVPLSSGMTKQAKVGFKTLSLA